MKKCICISVVTCTLLVLAASFLIIYFRAFHDRSKMIRYQVLEASLTQFELFNFNNTNTELRYNLAINATVENPNKKGSFYIEQVKAVASLGAVKTNPILSYGAWAPFSLSHGMVAYLASPSGNQTIPVAQSADEVSKLKNATVVDIIWRAYVKSWTKFRRSKVDFDYQVSCYLKVPLIADGKSAQRFNITKCTDFKKLDDKMTPVFN